MCKYFSPRFGTRRATYPRLVRAYRRALFQIVSIRALIYSSVHLLCPDLSADPSISFVYPSISLINPFIAFERRTLRRERDSGACFSCHVSPSLKFSRVESREIVIIRVPRKKLITGLGREGGASPHSLPPECRNTF